MHHCSHSSAAGKATHSIASPIEIAKHDTHYYYPRCFYINTIMLLWQPWPPLNNKKNKESCVPFKVVERGTLTRLHRLMENKPTIFIIKRRKPFSLWQFRENFRSFSNKQWECNDKKTKLSQAMKHRSKKYNTRNMGGDITSLVLNPFAPKKSVFSTNISAYQSEFPIRILI